MMVLFVGKRWGNLSANHTETIKTHLLQLLGKLGHTASLLGDTELLLLRSWCSFQSVVQQILVQCVVQQILVQCFTPPRNMHMSS